MTMRRRLVWVAWGLLVAPLGAQESRLEVASTAHGLLPKLRGAVQEARRLQEEILQLDESMDGEEVLDQPLYFDPSKFRAAGEEEPEAAPSRHGPEVAEEGSPAAAQRSPEEPGAGVSMLTLTTVVPPGAEPGQQLQITLPPPDGRQVYLSVPKNAQPGMTLTFQVEALPAVAEMDGDAAAPAPGAAETEPEGKDSDEGKAEEQAPAKEQEPVEEKNREDNSIESDERRKDTSPIDASDREESNKGHVGTPRERLEGVIDSLRLALAELTDLASEWKQEVPPVVESAR